MVNVFFAGCDGGDYANIIHDLKANMLFSYFHSRQNFIKDPKVKAKYPNANMIFIDSGAFSAKTLGKNIDLDEYIEFCKKTDADYYAVFDVIGDGDKTRENQDYMEKQGVNPVPCFHWGDDMKHLDYYCENYDFIALGGMVGNIGQIKSWLEVIFSKYPDKKFHGFGLTSPDMIKLFPWYSVDSSSWLMGSRTGTLWMMDTGSLHYDELDRNTQRANLFKDRLLELGMEINEIKTSYILRCKFNAIHYEQLSKVSNKKFKPVQNELASFFNSEEEEKKDELEIDMVQVRKDAIKMEFPQISDVGLEAIYKQRYGN